MRTYNIQWRGKGELHVTPVKASSLDTAKLMIQSRFGLRDSQLLEDEAML